MWRFLLEQSVRRQVLIIYGTANLILTGIAVLSWGYLSSSYIAGTHHFLIPVLYLGLNFLILATVIRLVMRPVNNVLDYIEALANGDLTESVELSGEYRERLAVYENEVSTHNDETLIKMMKQLSSVMPGDFKLENRKDEAQLISGTENMNGNNTIIDDYSHSNDCVATLFARKGDDFIRVTTSLKDTTGKRVVGSKLDSNSPAYSAIIEGDSCFGVAQLFGQMYETYYQPIRDKDMNVIGCQFVGMKQTLSNSNNEIINIVKGLNRLKGSLVTSISCISKTASVIADNFTQLHQQARNCDLQMQSQLDNTVSVANSMEDLITHSNTVNDYTRTATQTADSANTEVLSIKQILTLVLQSIEKLAKQIRFATQEMDAFLEETHNVESVLEVIKGIAEQTNLLALNAAIEAARAGDQGRGFAVVADEVRSLANRSKESAEEIDKLLERFKTKAVDANSFLAEGDKQASGSVSQAENAVGVALEAIMTAVNSINEINRQIENAVQDQTALSETINNNLKNISDSANDAANGSRQTVDAAMQLSASSQELNGLVSRFRL